MKIKFPIGDWSQDGHNMCDYYIAETPLKLEDVKKAHNDFTKKYFDIGHICKEYENNQLSTEQLKILKKLVDLEKFANYDDENDYWFFEETIALFELWIALLNVINPKLQLVSVEEDIVTFYGGKKGVPGYGLFYV